MATTIAPTAIIEEGAVIGDNVTIGNYVFISKDSTIGEGTTIAHGACIYGRTTIGKNNRIFSYAVIGSIPQDLKYNGEDTEFIIGDNNTIREFVLFNLGTEGGGGVTRIGSNNLLMGHVHLGHDVQIGNHCVIANSTIIAGHVEIGDHVICGGGCAVHQFCKIGEYAMLGGAAALAQDVPPYCIAEGNRAKIRGLNLTGLRRKFDKDEINPLRSAYTQLFAKGLPLAETAQHLLDQSTSEAVKNLARFVLETKRGINFDRPDNVAEEK